MAKNKTKKKNPFDQRIAIFRVGNQTDSNGNSVSISQDNLDSIVKNFDANDLAPHVIGHPKTNAPAFGWVKELEVDDGVLYASKHEGMNADFVKGVQDGAYRNRSVSIVKKGDEFKLSHIGWLGAAAPAVEGLPTNFSADTDILTFEFSSSEDTRRTGWSIKTLASLLRNFREYVIEKDGREAANKMLPSYEIDSLSNDGDRLVQGANDSEVKTNLFNSPENGESTKPKSANEGDDVNEDKNKELNFSAADIADAEKKAAETARQEVKAEMEHEQECKNFAKKLLDEGRILPAQLESVSMFLFSLDNTNKQPYCFSKSDDDSENKSQTNLDFAKQIFSSMPDVLSTLKKKANTDGEGETSPVSSFSVPAGFTVDDDQHEIHMKALQFQSDNDGTSYLDAVKAVSE